MCGEKRREFLKSVELLGKSIAGVRSALSRDRRLGERRGVGIDARVFRYDRRGGERRRIRALGDDDHLVVDDDMIIDILELADELAGGADEELTRIVSV